MQNYYIHSTAWARNFKTVQAKKKIVKSISLKKIFLQISLFAISKNDQKSIFELGKSLKMPRIQFHKFFLDLFDFTSFFFAWTFLIFLARCAIVCTSYKVTTSLTQSVIIVQNFKHFNEINISKHLFLSIL